MEQVSNEKLLDAIRHILSSVGGDYTKELHRLGALNQAIKEFVGTYISLESIQLIFDQIWLATDELTPYLTLCKLSSFETLYKDYLRDSISGRALIKYLGKEHMLVRHLMHCRGLFEAAAQMFPSAWLHKQVMRALHMLLEHSLVNDATAEFLDMNKLRENVHYFYVEIAYLQVEVARKRELIDLGAKFLGLAADSREYLILTGKVKDQDFLHKALLKLQHKLELNPKYKLQAELEEKLRGQILPIQGDVMRIKKLFEEWQKVREMTNEENRIMEAMAFIYNESANNSTEDHTELTFDFLLVHEQRFRASFKKKKKQAKLSKLIAFSRMWQMLLKLETISPFFQDAVILKAISVYKKLIKDEDLAEYAGMGLSLLGKIIPPKDYLSKYVDGIIPTIVFGIFFQQRSAARKLLFKVLDELGQYTYAQERANNEILLKLQFLNLESINREKKTLAKYIRDRIYRTKEDILDSLDYMIDYLPNANPYSQNLVLMYLNDIFKGPESYLLPLKSAMEENPELVKKVCHNLVRVNRSYTMHKIDITVAQSCARCIQSLGPNKVSYNLHQYMSQVWIAEKKLWKLRERPSEQGELLLEHLQDLAFKANKHFHNYIMALWKLKYLLYVDHTEELARKIPGRVNACFQFPESGGYTRINKKMQDASQPIQHYTTLVKYSENNNMKFLCLYLITKLQNAEFKKIFEAIESVIRADSNILIDLVPILIYLVLYHSKGEGPGIADQITGYLCEVIEGQTAAHKHVVFFCLEYLKKLRAYEYAHIREEVRKALSISCSDNFLEQAPKTTSTQTQLVLEFLGEKNNLKVGLAVNKLISRVMKGIPRINLIRAAKSIRAYKVALYYFEEECRSRVSEMSHVFEYMFCVLSREELDLLIEIYSNVNKEDLKSEYFSSIIKPSQWTRGISLDKSGAIAMEQYLIYCWKQGLWEELKAEVDKEELWKKLNDKKAMIDFSFSENTSLACIAKILSLIYSLVKHCGPDKYKAQYEMVVGYINFVQKEIMVDLCGASTTSTYVHSFYLYLLYDLKQFVEVIKTLLGFAASSKPPVEVFAEEAFQKHFDELVNDFLSRERLLLSKDIDQFKTLYFTHKALFQIINRPLYITLYNHKLAVLLSKHKEDYFDAFTLFNQCETHKEHILNYELQMAKTMSSLGSDYQASLYLRSQIPEIKRKILLANQTQTKNVLQSTTSFRALERSLLYLTKLEERFNTKHDTVDALFKELFSLDNAKTWEKAHFKHAKFLENIPADKGDYSEKILAEYLNSLMFGHRYIWQSLPKALELWFNITANSPKQMTARVNNMVRKIFQRLELFKIATAVPILTSRYGHPSAEVVKIIQDVLARLTVEYPKQQVWWLMNYYTYKEPSDKRPVLCEEDKASKEGVRHGKLKQEFGTADTKR